MHFTLVHGSVTYCIIRYAAVRPFNRRYAALRPAAPSARCAKPLRPVAIPGMAARCAVSHSFESGAQNALRVTEPALPAPCPSGLIRIDLPDGLRVSVDAHVDAGALARVLSVLR